MTHFVYKNFSFLEYHIIAMEQRKKNEEEEKEKRRKIFYNIQNTRVHSSIS